MDSRYDLEQIIGEGMSGQVFAARDRVTGERVAIKVLLTRRSDGDELGTRIFQDMLLQGAPQFQGGPQCGNLVSIMNEGTTEDGRPYYVMELLSGCSLRALLGADGALLVSRAVKLVLEACEGIRAGHALHLVHGDIKPENLFIVHPGQDSESCKVLDFGISRARAAVEEYGAPLGAVRYLAPEQARGQQADERADVFSLGSVLYECLAGTTAFPGESSEVVLGAILRNERAPLRDIAPWVPAKLVKVVDRAMAHDRLRRYQTVSAFAEALRGGAPWRSRPYWQWDRREEPAYAEVVPLRPPSEPPAPEPTLRDFPALLSPAHQAALELVAPHCDILTRLHDIRSDCKVRGWGFKALVNGLRRAGRLGEFRRYSANPRRSVYKYYPLRDYLIELAAAGAVLTNASEMHSGMQQLTEHNAADAADSALGRALFGALAHSPLELAKQGLSFRRHTCNYGTWTLTRVDNHGYEIAYRDEYIWLESAVHGTTTGMFDAVGISAEVFTRLYDDYSGVTIVRW